MPELDIENLLIEPAMVGQFFWTSVLLLHDSINVFTTYNKTPASHITAKHWCLLWSLYGFYRIGKGYVDEYGRALEQEPKLMGTYGVSSKDGLAYEIKKFSFSIW